MYKHMSLPYEVRITFVQPIEGAPYIEGAPDIEGAPSNLYH